MIEVKTLRTDTFSINYICFGTGTKPFVILPGLSVQSVLNAKDAIVEAYDIFTKDYKVYLFESRNELPSSFSIKEDREDMVKVFQLLGLKDIHLFGVSRGGMIAMDIAIHYPELIHKLVLASTPSILTKEQFQIFDEWIHLGKEKKLEQLFLTMGEEIYPKELFLSMKEMFIETSKTVTEEELKRFLILTESMRNFDVSNELESIQCPICFLYDKQDHVFKESPFQLIVGHLKNTKRFESYVYDGYGHALYDLAPDFKERILQFLVKE